MWGVGHALTHVMVTGQRPTTELEPERRPFGWPYPTIPNRQPYLKVAPNPELNSICAGRNSTWTGSMTIARHSPRGLQSRFFFLFSWCFLFQAPSSKAKQTRSPKSSPNSEDPTKVCAGESWRVVAHCHCPVTSRLKASTPKH